MSLDYALKLPSKRDTHKYLGDRAREKLQHGQSPSAGELRLLNVATFLAEIRNGGFDQFFWNSAGDNTHETIAALEKIGARRAAGILSEALELFPNCVAPKDRKERCRILEAVQGNAKVLFTRLNSEFLSVREDFVSLLYEDAVEHGSDFG